MKDESVEGYLIVNVYADNIALPIEGAKVLFNGKEYFTDEDGKTPLLPGFTVERKYSLEPQSQVEPFKLYDIEVSKMGLVTTVIKQIAIYEGITAVEDVFLMPELENNQSKVVSLTSSEIWESNTPKIFEEFSGNRPQSIVLNQVVIPQYIIVHDGIPTNVSAANYSIRFVDYIKNVACSEIYSTWPPECIKANCYCIISFALNRIYTEWYKSKGYISFDITSSSAYDQKFTYGRPIYDTISNIVNEIFNEYIVKENVEGPLLALYCDGITSNYSGWFKQWGSKDLAEKGFKALEILRYYFGKNISLQKANVVDFGISSYPGISLKKGDCSRDVQILQNYLNYITGSYPGIPKCNSDGNYTSTTGFTVEKFQEVFRLPVTGITDFATWYKVSYLYVAVKKMLNGVYL